MFVFILGVMESGPAQAQITDLPIPGYNPVTGTLTTTFASSSATGADVNLTLTDLLSSYRIGNPQQLFVEGFAPPSYTVTSNEAGSGPPTFQLNPDNITPTTSADLSSFDPSPFINSEVSIASTGAISVNAAGSIGPLDATASATTDNAEVNLPQFINQFFEAVTDIEVPLLSFGAASIYSSASIAEGIQAGQPTLEAVGTSSITDLAFSVGGFPIDLYQVTVTLPPNTTKTFDSLGITVIYNQQTPFNNVSPSGFTRSGLDVKAVDIQFSNTPIYFGLAAAFLLNGNIILGETTAEAQLVSTSTPAPASLLLLGAGLSGMALWRLKRRHET